MPVRHQQTSVMDAENLPPHLRKGLNNPCNTVYDLSKEE